MSETRDGPPDGESLEDLYDGALGKLEDAMSDFFCARDRVASEGGWEQWSATLVELLYLLAYLRDRLAHLGRFLPEIEVWLEQRKEVK